MTAKSMIELKKSLPTLGKNLLQFLVKITTFSSDPPPPQRNVSLVITDLDDTIWDWFAMWYNSFNPYFERISKTYSIEKEDLLKDFRNLHVTYHTSECSYIYQELKTLDKNQDLSEFERDKKELPSILHDYYSNKKSNLKLYDGVYETLLELKKRGVRIVGFTESQIFYTKYRLKHLGLDGLFDVVYTIEDHILPDTVTKKYEDDYWDPAETEIKTLAKKIKKPNGKILKEIILEQKAAINNTIYIGDKLDRDVYMAEKAGVFSVHAAYGKNIGTAEYELLKAVSHWSDEEIKREDDFRKSFKRAAIKPDLVLNNSFSEILNKFDFSEFAEYDEKNKEIAIEAWKKAVDVQQHFNEIELKIRNFAVTLFTFILTGVGFLYKEHTSIHLLDRYFSAASLLAFLGCAGIFLFYFMDKFWYHRLLLGSVYQAIDIETRWKHSFPELNLSEKIKKLSSLTILGISFGSNRKITYFYRGMLGLLFLLAVILFFDSPSRSHLEQLSKQFEGASFRSLQNCTCDDLPTNGGIVLVQNENHILTLNAVTNISSSYFELRNKYRDFSNASFKFLSDFVGRSELVDYLIREKRVAIYSEISRNDYSVVTENKDIRQKLAPTITKDRIQNALENDNAAEGLDSLTKLFINVLSNTLPSAIDVDDVAKNAAKKFIEEFSGQSGKNLSDLIFEWLMREEQITKNVDFKLANVSPDFIVHFDFDRSNVTPSGLKTISEVVERIRKSGFVIIIVGSADRIGSERYNQFLGLSRAESVERLLLRYGIPEYQIIRGVRSESYLPTQTDDNVLEPENRRVDIWLR